MKRIITIVFGTVLLAGILVLPQPDMVMAQSAVETIRGGVDSVGGSSDNQDAPSALKKIINTLLIIIGAVSVIMLIWGGFKYITSAGESGAVTSAKNTILYAIIGLVVALLAFAIAGFVMDAISGQSSGGTPPQPAPGSRPGDPY